MTISTPPLLVIILLGFAREPAINNKVDLGKEFKIKKGQEVVVRAENLHITFKSVSSDSRCPTGVQCVWAGNAAIKIGVSKKAKPMVATLNTSSEPKEFVHKGFRIKLIGLSPHPKINERIHPKDYEATIVVTKDN